VKKSVGSLLGLCGLFLPAFWALGLQLQRCLNLPHTDWESLRWLITVVAVLLMNLGIVLLEEKTGSAILLYVVLAAGYAAQLLCPPLAVAWPR